MTSNAELETLAAGSGHDQVPVLLVEDDDGDALLVEELLRDVNASVVVRRAKSLGQARTLVSDAACVLRYRPELIRGSWETLPRLSTIGHRPVTTPW